MIQQDLPPVNLPLPDSIPSPTEELSMLRSLPVDELINKVVNGITTLAINIVIAVVVFYIGRFIINKINALLGTIFLRRRAEKSLATFTQSLVKMLLYFLLIIVVVGILGIETSSFIALFASAGVAIGMALSGTLQNFAGGVLIMLLKPYRVGDYIEIDSGKAGTVTEIQIFHTIINTPDNKTIIIPNGGLSTGTINNYNRADYRRVEWTVSISYGDDVDAARAAILAIIDSDNRIVRKYIEDDREMRARIARETAEAVRQAGEEPEDDHEEECDPETDPDCEEPRHSWIWRLFHRQKEKVREKVESWQEKERRKLKSLVTKTDRSPVVWVSQLADSSVNLVVRVWTRADYYWNVYFTVNERIYKELPAAGIHFPFPQLDVHLANP